MPSDPVNQLLARSPAPTQTAAITAIAGAPGSGKTRWIAQQLEANGGAGLYCPLGGTGLSLDAILLRSQFPDLEVMEQASIGAIIAQNRSVYLELDNSVDLAQFQLPNELTVERVGLLPQGWYSNQLEDWSDRLLPALTPLPPVAANEPAQICAVELTGQVFDPPSLDVIWQEITGGAYGNVQRAKGVFSLADGATFYFSFVIGQPSTYTHLNLAPCLQGRPHHPSALEVVGLAINGEALTATLTDCLLPDDLLQQHQSQLKVERNDHS